MVVGILAIAPGVRAVESMAGSALTPAAASSAPQRPGAPIQTYWQVEGRDAIGESSRARSKGGPEHIPVQPRSRESPTKDRLARAQEDRRLLERYHHEEDPAAREALVERFLPLARQLARRYQRAGEPLDDLIQVASLGLLKAIERFDPERETAFSSFAVPTILGELKRHFRDKGWSVRVPRDLQELAVKVDRVGEDMGRELGRAPTPAEIGERVGATPGAGARGARGRRRLPRGVARPSRATRRTRRASSPTRSAARTTASRWPRTPPRSSA